MRIPSRLQIPVGRGDLTLQPMMWMFLAILLTFLLTRTVTRLIRSGSGGGVGLGNVSIAGNHVHHQVFGILIIIGTGVTLISTTPQGAALDAAAAVFGAGVGLTVDEFALWLHLEDVYWAEQGRKSVDAIFCVLVITGALIGGTSFATGRVGTAAWWSSVGVIAVNLVLCLICLLKGKVMTGVIGIFISVVAVVGAIRLAKPGSWWAQHRYASRPRLARRAEARYDQRYHERWNRLRDFVAGAPTRPAPGGGAQAAPGSLWTPGGAATRALPRPAPWLGEGRPSAGGEHRVQGGRAPGGGGSHPQDERAAVAADLPAGPGAAGALNGDQVPQFPADLRGVAEAGFQSAGDLDPTEPG